MTAATRNATPPYYFVPSPSQFPLHTAVGMFFVILGASQWINDHHWGMWVFLLGLVIWLVTLFRWFSTAIDEDRRGLYSERVDVSFRWSMSWFIFSEVMFFAAFFGALFFVRNFSLPMLGDLDHQLLWPDFRAAWPTVLAGSTVSPAGTIEPFAVMAPWPLPTVNTALLLTSGVTLTIAHHKLIANERGKTVFWMVLTVLLGITFLCVQSYEYIHAYNELNLKLSSGVFGSTFFMLTGFHGFHVLVGMLTLAFVTARIVRGDFTPQSHFGFEGAAWYWHFVDVVWLGLYIFVYWF